MLCRMTPIRLVDEGFVYEAPLPMLAGLERTNHRVIACMKVFGCMLVLGIVATADMTARKTQSQVYPLVAGFQAFFAALRRFWFGIPGVLKVDAEL
jgi:hypothetical protein